MKLFSFRSSTWANLKNSVGVSFLIAFIFVLMEPIEEWNFPDHLELRIEMKSSVTGTAKVYYDIGNGLNEKDLKTYKITKREGFQALKFPLPTKPIHCLRFDPLDRSGSFSIQRITLFDNLHRLILPIKLQALYPSNQIRYLKIEDKVLKAETEPDAIDPTMSLELEYPLSLATVYPVIRRIKDNFIEKFVHMRKAFCVVFLISWVAMFFAYADLKQN